jgi:hypothetical protein
MQARASALWAQAKPPTRPPMTEPAPAPAKGPLRFGHWSTGELAIDRARQALFEFVRRVGGAA